MCILNASFASLKDGMCGRVDKYWGFVMYAGKW